MQDHDIDCVRGENNLSQYQSGDIMAVAGDPIVEFENPILTEPEGECEASMTLWGGSNSEECKLQAVR